MSSQSVKWTLACGLGMAALAGCARPPLSPTSPAQHHYGNDGATVCFPASFEVRHTHEGPLAQAIIVHSSHKAGRFEWAQFDLPRPLSRAKRGELMANVERGLQARRNIVHTEVGTVVSNGVVARVLSLRFRNGRRAKWLVSFPTSSRMLQVSVIGPEGLRGDTERFLESVGATDCNLAPD